MLGATQEDPARMWRRTQAQGREVPPNYFVSPYFFVWVKGTMQNDPKTAPSRRKLCDPKEMTRKIIPKIVDTMFPLQRPRALNSLRSDQFTIISQPHKVNSGSCLNLGGLIFICLLSLVIEELRWLGSNQLPCHCQLELGWVLGWAELSFTWSVTKIASSCCGLRSTWAFGYKGYQDKQTNNPKV